MTTNTIRVMPRQPTAGWTPMAAKETMALLSRKRLGDQERATLLEETSSILGSCVPPQAAHGRTTGLVVGYVQSGKTLSFTTVAAMARDNGYRMVIVIAGTSVNLAKQNSSRLIEDLQIDTAGARSWVAHHNPKLADKNLIEGDLADWRDERVPRHQCRTVLITVMKQHTHLEHLLKLLGKLDLSDVPVLLVDDEADQAGLNTERKKGGVSRTYVQLSQIRSEIPHLSYLQYTATPQAPLLINVIDILSPEFAEVITPGRDYTGGAEFFRPGSGVVRTIPASEIANSVNSFDPPPSYISALRVFFLGVAAGLLEEDRSEGHRSMMVHPSHSTSPHASYYDWSNQAISRWRRQIAGDTLEQDEIGEEFKAAYEDLKATVSNLPEYDLLLSALRRALNKTHVIELNSRGRKTPTIEWSKSYGWILVGGQAMDRGYTVKGLTVTYMPRGVGSRFADTIQQRARFFGYKRKYLGYCRVYLETDTERSFRKYVGHEEDVRDRLKRFRAKRKPLHEWRRAFFLDKSLKPTRDCVLDIDHSQSDFADAWWNPKEAHSLSEAVEANRRVVDDFVSSHSFVPDVGHPGRRETMKHLVLEGVSLRTVLEECLMPLKYAEQNDSINWTGILLQVLSYIDRHPDAEATVYLMRPHERTRRTLSKGQLVQLFQGAYPSQAPNQGAIYRGDRELRRRDSFCIQIHSLDLRDSSGATVCGACPVVAIWIPKDASRSWLVQEEVD